MFLHWKRSALELTNNQGEFIVAIFTAQSYGDMGYKFENSSRSYKTFFFNNEEFLCNLPLS